VELRRRLLDRAEVEIPDLEALFVVNAPFGVEPLGDLADGALCLISDELEVELRRLCRGDLPFWLGMGIGLGSAFGTALGVTFARGGHSGPTDATERPDSV
jgi:hypothetical protein